MNIETHIPLLEDLLSEWKETLGSEYEGYRNNVYRMIHFCLALRDCNEEEKEKIIIVAVYHDIGIWIKDTVDYIEPSLPPLHDYLEVSGREAWLDELTLMLTEHHKIRKVTEPRYPLVELFRKGDLVDFSLGAIRFGLDKHLVNEVKTAFPNAGFHKNLGHRAWKWFLKHPLNPAPMMKW